MHRSDGFGHLGGVKPSLALCLVIVFLLVYFALWKGPRSTGKVKMNNALKTLVGLSGSRKFNGYVVNLKKATKNWTRNLKF